MTSTRTNNERLEACDNNIIFTSRILMGFSAASGSCCALILSSFSLLLFLPTFPSFYFPFFPRTPIYLCKDGSQRTGSGAGTATGFSVPRTGSGGIPYPLTAYFSPFMYDIVRDQILGRETIRR